MVERPSNLCAGKRFRDQQNTVGLPRTKALVRLVRRIADDDDRKVGMGRVVSHHVEERLAHLEVRAIEHERVGALVDDQLTDRVSVAGGDDLVSAVAQREGQQLRDLRRVVDEQDAGQSY